MPNAKFLTPVVTAFDDNGKLDISANKAVYDRLILAGLDGLLIMGSAGEFYSLSMDERKKMIDLALSYAADRIKVILGTGCMTIQDSIELSQYAVQRGATDIILMSPYYFCLSDQSIYEFFSQIADAVDCNIYLYNFPDRTGYDLKPELTLKLIAAHSNIVGYKDTVSDMAHTRRLINKVKPIYPDFEIYSGFDENFSRNILSDGNGAIGALSNVFPELFAEFVTATNSHDFSKLQSIQQNVDKLMSLYDITDCFIPIIKKAMSLRGIAIKDNSRSPLLHVTAEQTKIIKEIIDTAGVEKFIKDN